MTQKSLFDNSPTELNHYGYPITRVARASDPGTSPKAAAKVEPKLKGTRQVFYRTLKRSSIPLTAKEVAAEAVPLDGKVSVDTVIDMRDTLRKRARELVNLGYVRKVGSRICRVTGSEAAVYEVVTC